MVDNDIEKKYQELNSRRETLLASKLKIEAELAARKRALKEAMDECKKLGLNPDTLADDLKTMREVLNVKISVFEADLNSAEEAMKPLLKEIG